MNVLYIFYFCRCESRFRVAGTKVFSANWDEYFVFVFFAGSSLETKYEFLFCIFAGIEAENNWWSD